MKRISLSFIFLTLFAWGASVQVWGQTYNVPQTGSASITTCSGTLYDNNGTSNYSNSCSGYTVINPATAGSLIRVSGSITVEGGYDYLTIYDGSGTTGTVLWGGSKHGTGTSCATFTVPEITSITGPLTVQFYSDGTTRCQGFALAISCYTPNYAAQVTSINYGSNTWCIGDDRDVSITLKNVGSRTWYAAGAADNTTCSTNPNRKVALSFGWNGDGMDAYTTPPFTNRTPLPNDVAPGASVTVTFKARTPWAGAGTNNLHINLIAQECEWFSPEVYTSPSISVNAKPTITSVTATPSTISCGGSSQLQASVSGMSGTYTWDPNPTLSATNIANPVASPTASTTYEVTATANGCSSTATVNVNVTPLTISNAPSSVCPSTSINLDVSGTTEWASLPTNGVIVAGANPNNEYYSQFNASGTFNTPVPLTNATVLVVAGGGGGGLGACNVGAPSAGGAGGLLYSTLSIPSGPTSVTVGNGGASNTNGQNSVFSTLTAVGGGRGGYGDNSCNFTAPLNGGSGGSGGSNASYYNTATTTGSGTVGQGSAGGLSPRYGTYTNYVTAGGGGAGGVGTVPTAAGSPGNGGIGLQYSITGVPTYYAGGGGGYAAARTSPTPVIAAATGSPGSGTIGQGGTAGGAGKDGTVIIRYRAPKWSVVSTTGSATASFTNEQTGALSIGSGTGTITVRYTNEVGCSSADVVITVGTPSAPTIASITQPTCATATATVNFSGLPSSGTWTLTSTPSGFNKTGTGTTTSISGITANATYTWTVNNGSCTSSSSSNAVVNAQPVTPSAPTIASITQPTCGTATATVNFSGLPSSGTWTLTSTPSGFNKTGTGTTTSISGVTANTTYTWTVSNGSCTSASSANAVVNTQPLNPTASAGSALSAICQSGTSSAMGGSIGGGATGGTWSGGAGTWTNATNPSTATYQAGASESGTITLTLTTSGGSCGTTTATKTIAVDAKPTLPTSITVDNNTNNCWGREITLTENGGVLQGASQYIYGTSPGGTQLNAGTTSTTQTTVPTGSATYYVGITANGACAAQNLPTGVTVNLPTKGSTLSTSEAATCYVSGTNPIHFYNTGTGNYIGSINPQGRTGTLTMTAYTGGVGDNTMYACNRPTAPQWRTAFMERRFTVIPTGSITGAGNLDVYFPFTGTEFSNLVTNSGVTSGNAADNVSGLGDLVVTKYSNSGSENGTPYDNCLSGVSSVIGQNGQGATLSFSGAPSPAVTANYISVPVSSFSEFYLHGQNNASPLPITLTSFSGNCEKDGVHLAWVTATETNVNHFEVERSRNGQTWEVVATVSAVGNSSVANSYQAIDVNGFETLYYRLRSVDNDGTSETFNPIAVTCEVEAATWNIHPIPVSTKATITINATTNSQGTLVVSDINGRTISSQNVQINEGVNNYELDVQHLSEGTYFMRLEGSSTYKPLKFMKIN